MREIIIPIITSACEDLLVLESTKINRFNFDNLRLLIKKNIGELT